MFTMTTVSERSNDDLEVLCDGDDDSSGGWGEEEGGTDHQEVQGEGGGRCRPAGGGGPALSSCRAVKTFDL